MKNKTRELLKDTGLFALGNLGSKLILFFLVPLYTNFLSTSEYGISDYVFTLSQLITPVVSVSIWDSVTRFGLKKGVKKEDVILDSFIVIGISGILLIIINPLFGLYKTVADYKLYLTLYSFGSIINQIEYNYLRVKNKISQFAICSILQTVFLASLNIVLLVVFKLGIVGYLSAYVISIFACNIVLFFAGEINKDLFKGSIDFRLLKDMIVFSSPMIINNISWWIIHSSDKIMIEMAIGASALGIYTVATKIPSMINVFITIFSQAWGISSIKEIESLSDSNYFSNVFRIYYVLAFSASTILMLIIKPFMLVYVGDGFKESWIYVPFLLVAASFSAIAAYFGSISAALMRSEDTMKSTMVGGILNIILNYIFIREVGIWGAILGTVISYLVISNLRLYMVIKAVHIDIDYKNYIINICLIICQALLISIDINPYFVSTIAIFIFIFINKTLIISFYTKLKNRLNLRKGVRK